jgi:hypothetical protein
MSEQPQAWTAERWYLDGDEEGRWFVRSPLGGGREGYYEWANVANEEIGRLIVACVNAMQGVADPAAFRKCADELIAKDEHEQALFHRDTEPLALSQPTEPAK